MLEQMASNLGLGNVSFLGFQKDVFYWMAKAKVMVLPSRWEGLPIALLEAMAFGIPVICTTVGGIADVIEQDDSGILIPPGNTNELSAAICRILEDGDLRDRLATRARVTVNERFDVKKLVKQILDLYRTMLDSRGKDKGRIS
jgi:glycosyltransferase involved in cell wall biosynthesis